jgi:hypothetical protein
MTTRISHEMAKACVLDSLWRFGTWATFDELVADACEQAQAPRHAVSDPVRAAVGALMDLGTIEEGGSAGFRLKVEAAIAEVMR